MADEIDDKLDRVNRRFEARRAAVRSRLEARPELGDLLEGLKATFGPIRVTYLQVGDWSDGDPDAIYELDGQRLVRCAHYRAPRVGRKGRMAELREREAPSA